MTSIARSGQFTTAEIIAIRVGLRRSSCAFPWDVPVLSSRHNYHVRTTAPGWLLQPSPPPEHLPYVIVIRKRPTGCSQSESLHLREFSARSGRPAVALPLDLFHFIQAVRRPNRSCFAQVQRHAEACTEPNGSRQQTGSEKVWFLACKKINHSICKTLKTLNNMRNSESTKLRCNNIVN